MLARDLLDGLGSGTVQILGLVGAVLGVVDVGGCGLGVRGRVLGVPHVVLRAAGVARRALGLQVRRRVLRRVVRLGGTARGLGELGVLGVVAGAVGVSGGGVSSSAGAGSSGSLAGGGFRLGGLGLWVL